MQIDRTAAEVRRLARLHAAFLQAHARITAGATIVSELRRLHRRRLKGPFRKYSVGSLWRLFFRWRRDPRPEILVRRYKPGHRRQLSARDTRTVLRALRESPALAVTATVASVNRDRGPAERIGVRAVYRMLRARLPARWSTLRRLRLAAQREVDHIDALLVAAECESTSRVPSGASS